ncbi:MAG: phosphate ABC transporter permease subunit PstC [Syntrophomonadaceae bacterium]
MRYSLASQRDKFWGAFFFLIALICSLLLAAVLLFMLKESWPVWTEIGAKSFLLATAWNPMASPPEFSIAPMLVSTIWVAAGSLLIAAPIGFACAIFLAEFAPAPLADILRPVLNILTGIPSVVYGFLGAAVLVRFFERSLGWSSGESLFLASLVLALMVLPFIVANSEAALRSVPAEYRYAALALGVSKTHLAIHVLVPLARKGMLGSLALAFGRAAGETMAVLMLAGNILLTPGSWLDKGEPLPALIALELGSAVPGSPHYQALLAAGLVLVVIVMIINLLLNNYLHTARNEVNRFE